MNCNVIASDGNINDTFSLRRDTGELLLAKPLDYANVSAFDIEYAVSDGVETTHGKVWFATCSLLDEIA